MEKIKQQLIISSFKMQDEISSHNSYLNDTPEQLYENKEQISLNLQRVKALLSKK